VITPNALTNRRQFKRHQLSAEIKIVDNLQKQAIGKLVDIHQEGLLLLGTSFKIDSSHQVKLILPHSVNLQSEFILGIECLWCQKAYEDSTLFWAGCSIIDKSEFATGCIESLINIQS
jgi:hypothetical protein